MTQIEYDLQLVNDIARLTHNPYGFVKYAYPWGEGVLQGSGSDKPREWQKDILLEIGKHLSNPETRFTPLQIAVSSGHGIGKSALISWVLHWAMSTCEDCRCTITAETEPQLRTKTWPEITKWITKGINRHWFKTSATTIMSAERGHEKTWRADSIAWSENNSEAFAGMHNKGKRVVLVFDEGSGIADIIYEVAEGALTDADTEIIWLVFGNPTKNTGRFRECFGKFKHRWITRQIDSRTVEGTNKDQINKWINDYGEDSDYCRIRVRGVFPRAGSSQFIDSESVFNCTQYVAEGYHSQAKIFGVDVARFGDDQNVVCIRQGRKIYELTKWRGLDTMQTASRIAKLFKDEKPDTVFVDGGGVGGGVVDRLKQLIPEEKIIEVNFGETKRVHDKHKYFNKRAEMWGDMRDAIIEGMSIPYDTELIADLEAVEYGFSSDQKIQLEKKEDMKKRGLSSPDCGDAMALTFAEDIIKNGADEFKEPFLMKHNKPEINYSLS